MTNLSHIANPTKVAKLTQISKLSDLIDNLVKAAYDMGRATETEFLTYDHIEAAKGRLFSFIGTMLVNKPDIDNYIKVIRFRDRVTPFTKSTEYKFTVFLEGGEGMGIPLQRSDSVTRLPMERLVAAWVLKTGYSVRYFDTEVKETTTTKEVASARF